MDQVRRTRMALAAFLVFGLALVAGPASALAGVSGQLEAWKTSFGTEPGELFNPKLLGVDPVDGSVYISNQVPEEPETRIDKFSASGTLEGTMLVDRTPTTPNEQGLLASFVGIAVDHSLGRFYLVKDEAEVDKREPEARAATEVLVFSTTPRGGALVPATTPSLPLPAPESSETLLGAQELAVDPSNHDLVLAARSPAGNVVLQRISSAGVVGARYEEKGTALRQNAGESFYYAEGNYGFAMAPDGTTDIVAQVGLTAEAPEVRGFSLPPGFTSGLTPLPGFEATAETEGWGKSEDAFRVVDSVNGFGRGPQVALAIAPDGEETLFWKATHSNAEEERVDLVLHGYSLQQHQTTAAYGGGTTRGHCAIQTTTAAIAATKNGNVVVLDQGLVSGSPSEAPEFGLSVLRFGPGGSLCPTPAALTKLKVGSSEVDSVAAGTKVTLDATGSELGSNFSTGKANALRGLTWTIEGPGGTEEIPVSGKPPSETLEHVFGAPGEYTIRLDLKTDSVEYLGTNFAARPVKLQVTGSSTAPTVTGISPSHGAAAGGVVVTITGTRLDGANGVSFGGVAATNVQAVSSTEVKATSPACTPGSTAHVTVTTGSGTSAAGPGDVYSCDGNGQPVPTVTEVTPSHGSPAGGTVVTIKGSDLNGATGVRFGSAAATEVTPVSATELRATSPAGSGVVDVVVTTGGGASATGSADKFSYDSSATRAFTVARAGSGAGSVSCNGVHCEASYPVGTVVTLSALASNGSTFVGWSGGNCSGAGVCSITVEENVTVTAAFNLVGAPPVTPVAKRSAGTAAPSGGGSKSGSTPSTTAKTKAQIIAENRKKALAECQKLKGKAKSICVKRANQIGKEKQKPVKEFGAEEKPGKKHDKKHRGKKKPAKKHSAKKSKS